MGHMTAFIHTQKTQQQMSVCFWRAVVLQLVIFRQYCTTSDLNISVELLKINHREKVIKRRKVKD